MPVNVAITSPGKPEIPADFEARWQEIIDLAARIVGVPAGLIMRLHEREIEVFLASETHGNPYEPAERTSLGIGLYCETVVGSRAPLLVPDAQQDELWKDNPDVKLNMISYFGVPIRWPDGEVFGTFCVLDSKDNSYSHDQRELIMRLSQLVESDLDALVRRQHSLGRIAELELRNREIRHRVKNQFNMLISYIDLYREHNGEPNAAEDLAGSLKQRIASLSSVHNSLSRTTRERELPAIDYLRELAELAVGAAPVTPALSLDSDGLTLDEPSLIALGTIVNELITNSIKHAFAGVAEPEIQIDVRGNVGEGVLEYRDNGVGFGPGFVSPGLGSSIVAGTARQLGGSLEQDSDHGFFLRLVFPRRCS
ncbi:MAG: GAF domain-containing protein [Spirochaetes bacterium]|nr:GAF domain-containing protein [Spirochaetota bacterium]